MSDAERRRPVRKWQAWLCLLGALGAAFFLGKGLATGTFENARYFGTVNFSDRPLAFMFLVLVYALTCIALGGFGLHVLTRRPIP